MITNLSRSWFKILNLIRLVSKQTKFHITNLTSCNILELVTSSLVQCTIRIEWREEETITQGFYYCVICSTWQCFFLCIGMKWYYNIRASKRVFLKHGWSKYDELVIRSFSYQHSIRHIQSQDNYQSNRFNHQCKYSKTNIFGRW
jgi:hypothetical protein